MDRSLKRLKLDDFGPPYFLAYRMVDDKAYDATAAFGSALSESEDDYGVLFVEARYGDKSLDNTDLSYQGWHGAAAKEASVLRQNLWNLTDSAYKNAVAGYLEKKAKRATEFIPDVLDDFSAEPATSYFEPQPAPSFDRARARAIVERISSVFRRHPLVFDSRVSLHLGWSRRYFLSSEGARIATPYESVPSSLHVAAMTRAEDGMRLDNSKGFALQGLDALPSPAALEAAAEKVAVELERLRAAPVQPPLSAPAILDGELTGVLFHEALGHKLEGQRQRDPQQSQVFKEMVGKRVVPELLSVYDDPTLAYTLGEPLHGSYAFDSEGVAARRVALVERGVLKNFLMSRWPVKGFSKSNGHGRSEPAYRPTGRMANLIVKAEAPVPRAELTSRLLELTRKSGKPYGFLLVGSFGGDNPTGRGQAQTLEVRPRLIYRVDAKTGAQTLVRGVAMVGTPLVVLNRIVAAGDDPALGNTYTCGAESGHVPVSQTAPSVLVSEVELQRLPEDRARPPILPSPLHDRDR
ncbi:MAG: TldD/PmbA family protein [Elusimicrobia bacterium]|nr:TldD/PmbA family protein [Elusimicrobiota bacterium]